MPYVAALSTLKPYQKGIIVDTSCLLDSRVYIEEIGLLKGTPIQLVQISPLKELFYICFRGTQVAIKQKIAELIKVQIP